MCAGNFFCACVTVLQVRCWSHKEAAESVHSQQAAGCLVPGAVVECGLRRQVYSCQGFWPHCTGPSASTIFSLPSFAVYMALAGAAEGCKRIWRECMDFCVKDGSGNFHVWGAV